MIAPPADFKNAVLTEYDIMSDNLDKLRNLMLLHPSSGALILYKLR